ncbi:hypothetical protein [Nocardioides bruguierae]|uniref:hypothetical protein n=1 Tax=Nocardioides bruguierae TaxID=2945102 RepID=UPI002021EAF0|nr:hypothetical protein [Nocardioides bruguierae]MCL8027351.1 hypothetical protein [Nocardioides bruguierae]
MPGRRRLSRGPRRRSAVAVSAVGVLAAFVGSSLLVYQASSSAYTSTTANAGNSWSSGVVSITDDDTGTALFTVNGLKPGSAGEACIKVSSTSTVAGSVKLYATGYSTTNNLAASLDLTVQEGTGGTFPSCAGFVSSSTAYTGTLAGFSTKTSFGTGVGSWSLTGTPTETRVYRIAYSLDAAAPDSTQGGTAGLGFTWEAQSS